MLNQGTGTWPHRRSRRAPDATAITFRGRSRTYRELDERVTRLAHALRGLGVGRGDRVAGLSANHPAYLETLFAAGLLGAIFVPLNARLTAPEVAYALRDSGATVLIHSAAVGKAAVAAAEQAGRPARIVIDPEPGTSDPGYEEIIAAAPTDRIDVPVDLGDPCYIMYTSGTTGRPKGVVLTHGNVVFAAMNPILDLDLVSTDVSLVVAPLFHVAALNHVALPTLLKGAALIVEEGFDAGRVLRLIEGERVSFSFGVPTMLDAMCAHPDWASTDLSSIRCWVVAAAPVPTRMLQAYAARGVRLSQAYGLTETGPGALCLPPDDAERKLGSAGTPHFFTDVRVVDVDGTPATPGERGEIQISGPNVLREYWNQPEATAAAFTDDRWFRSGDVGVSDDEGFVTIVDRLKDMIISGGENIYPAEIEAAILEIPGVLECAVFGVPDEKWGEVGRAAVALAEGCSLTEDELRAFLAGRLAAYKVPKSLIVLDEIPRNATGKIRKDRLRAQYAH